MSLFLARVEVNLVGRCFLLTSTAADNGSDRNWVFASSGQSSLASGSIIPSWWHRVLDLCPLSYRLTVLSEMWCRHSSVSSTTMPEPLSALLMTKVWSSQSC